MSYVNLAYDASQLRVENSDNYLNLICNFVCYISLHLVLYRHGILLFWKNLRYNAALSSEPWLAVWIAEDQ
ncbi:MAG TPA: hypothetical protein DCS30_16230 [Rhizobiales bacterium]|nr:hypothetical protein [Hyphomicrobiales bacterium]